MSTLHRPWLALCLVGCAALSSCAGLASDRTHLHPAAYTIQIDIPPSQSIVEADDPEDAQGGQVEVQRFMPSHLRVHPGDTVTWISVARSSHHTVTFAPNRGTLPDFLTFATKQGSRPRLQVNPAVANPCVDPAGHVSPALRTCGHVPQPGETSEWNGEGYLNSGPLQSYFPLPGSSEHVRRFSVRLSSRIAGGVYRYYDELLPHLDGELEVVEPSVPIPSPDQVAAETAREAETAADRIKATHDRTPSGVNVIVAGAGTTDGTLNMFNPSVLTVPRGTVVTWVNESKGTGEYHTVTFAPVDIYDREPLASGECGPPSHPQTWYSLFCPSGGRPRVFLNPRLGLATARSGGLYVDDASSGLFPSMYPATSGDHYQLRFTTPGVYTYVCLVHPGMTGEIIVT